MGKLRRTITSVQRNTSHETDFMWRTYFRKVGPGYDIYRQSDNTLSEVHCVSECMFITEKGL